MWTRYLHGCLRARDKVAADCPLTRENLFFMKEVTAPVHAVNAHSRTGYRNDIPGELLEQPQITKSIDHPITQSIIMKPLSRSLPRRRFQTTRARLSPSV